MNTTNPFIAAQCDQTGEVCKLDNLTAMTEAMGGYDADFAGADELTDVDIRAIWMNAEASEGQSHSLNFAREIIAADRALRKPAAVPVEMPVVMQFKNQTFVLEADAMAALAAKDAEIEALRKGNDRYEVIRKLYLRQFADLYAMNITGQGRFDDLVDALASTPPKE